MFRKSLKKGKKIAQDSDSEQETQLDIVKLELPKKRGLNPRIQKEEVPTQEYLGKKFIKEKSSLEKIREKGLEKHIKQNLKQLDKDEEFEIPDKYKPNNRRITEGGEKSLWLAGLAEIPLSVEYKIDNIEATEAAKRKAIKGGDDFNSRFQHLHEDDIEVFTLNMTNSRNLEKEIERLEKNMLLRGRKYKKEKEERVKMNELYENAWKN